MDNQSTVNIFCGHTLIKNIRRVSGHINILCNVGISSTNWVGYLEGFGTLWYHKEGILNILSLENLQANYHITYNSQYGKAFLLVNTDGQAHSFRISDQGLYYLDRIDKNVTNLNTVVAKISKYYSRDCSPGVKYRRLHKIIGRPGIKQFLEILYGGIPNCPVLREYALVA